MPDEDEVMIQTNPSVRQLDSTLRTAKQRKKKLLPFSFYSKKRQINSIANSNRNSNAKLKTSFESKQQTASIIISNSPISKKSRNMTGKNTIVG